MLISMEVPTSDWDFAREVEQLTDISFVIATECLKNSCYLNFYKTLKTQEKKLIILDNGMYEENRPLDGKTFKEIALEIQADVVFAPDQLFFMNATIDLTQEFLEISKGTPYRVGVIPQGQTLEEWWQCYEFMVNHFKFDGPIGLSFLNDRPTFLKTYGHKFVRRWHHMLGLRHLDEIRTWPMKDLLSLDTVKPIKAAYFGYKLEECPRGLGKWSSYWELSPAQKSLVYRNIALLRKVCNDRRCN